MSLGSAVLVNSFPCRHEGEIMKLCLKVMTVMIVLMCFSGVCPWLVTAGFADEDCDDRRYLEKEKHHYSSVSDSDNEGDETTGQIALLLLVIANFPVFISIVTKWVNRFFSLGPDWKSLLMNFNRVQKSSLMWLHYYINILMICFVLIHWFLSRCTASVLPEFGLFCVFLLVISGFFTKFKLFPISFKSSLIKIHMHPLMFFLSMLFLTIGHFNID